MWTDSGAAGLTRGRHPLSYSRTTASRQPVTRTADHHPDAAFAADIYDEGLVRNFSKAKFNTTDVDDAPSLQQLEAGFFPGFDWAAPAGAAGSVVSPFRRIHHNFLIANYNADAAVLLDDGGSRFLQYDNYVVYGNVGVGESCHNSQWVYGIANMCE